MVSREELMQFIAEKGFVYGPSPEIYDGGVSGFYDFGPLGKTLKNNIENSIRKAFSKQQFFEVECPIVTPRKVWEASGHLGGFTDPLIKCDKTQTIWRADHMIEEQYPHISAENMTIAQMEEFIAQNPVICPKSKEPFKPKIFSHNLMLKTTVGVEQEMYNRPETATTTYLPFLNYVRFFREKFPFGVFQIGNAYRNEISPRQHVIRGREFTQAEAQVFLFKDQKDSFEKFDELKDIRINFLTADAQKKDGKVVEMSLGEAIEKKILKNKAYAWTIGMTYQLFLDLGFPKNLLRYNQHLPEKLAFYADDAWDLEISFNSFGWIECCGVHDRTDYDLTTHGKHSGKNLDAINPKTNAREIPHVLEIAIGPNRLLLAALDIFYNKKEEDVGKSKLQLPPKLSPVKVAIFPLVKKEGLQKVAKDIFNELSEDYIVQYDEAGAIGKRYLRQDTIGTPFCITVDFDSIEKDSSVTIRSRDSEEQVRVPITAVKSWIRNNI